MPDVEENTAKDAKPPLEEVRPALLVDRQSIKYSEGLRHLLIALADEPCSAAIICPSDIDTELFICPGVESIRYPLIRTPLFIKQNRSVLMQHLEKFKPTVLHCIGSGKIHIARIISNRLNIPYVVTFNRVGRRIFKPSINQSHCTTLIASSKTIADYLKKAYPRFGLRIRHINIGVYIEDETACFAKIHKIPSLIIAQPLNNVKDFEPLLNAIRHLVLDGNEFVFAIIGTGPAERKIYGLIRSLGLSQIVSLIPDMQPLRSIFAGADIFIQPRSTNDFNQRLLEAMSVGMAVATCRNCTDDMLIPDRTALFFDSNDELSIYDCLHTLLSKPELAKNIAAAGQQYLKKNHTVSRMTNALMQTYRDAQQKYKTPSAK